MRRALAPLAACVVLGAVSARADDAAGCAKFKWPVARERAAFAAPALPIVASGETLPGTAATVALQPQAGLALPHKPGRPPKADPAFAAVLTLPPIEVAGSYTVTLSDEAWIDVWQDGREIRSSGFSGQPDCPGVRKSVKFALQPGPASIQISGAAKDRLNVDVLQAE